ncbi:MAG: polysaccharide pyruvyl transferase CsaB [Bacillota bacterium]|nr:polysaccharide pyruvyl transferase CsaB [Bacillota bacterium]
MKILMTLMGLDIGGVETHVVELSKELKKRGNEVVVVSAGGAYQHEIEAANIKHYYAPLLTHSASSMLKSYKILKKVITIEKPDIVHAHARIPAFLCHIIHKTNKSFSFVTSVHCPFTTRGLMGKLSRWGSKSMAVSDDLKYYVTQNYRKVKSKNVYVSVNGIDTEKFSNVVSGDDIVREFHLNPNATRIVYVSRLDRDVCTPAYSLLEIFPRLIEHIPDLELIIVGKGNGFDELLSMANDINVACGRNAVVMTGARTDVYKINAAATFCIGVSRAILEGMAESKPAILAGNYGYTGIFTKDKLSSGIGNNFTCRGTGTLDNEALFDDIMSLYSMPKEEFNALGEYCRSVVLEYYSIRKMANDNYKMYEAALSDGKYDVAILGYYGFHNSGDDALLHAVITSLRTRNPDVRILVFSNTPEETARVYKVSASNRFDILAMKKILKNTKLFIMGGGSLLQDGTSSKSLLYYIMCLKIAKRFCAKTMLYANGIGPILRKSNGKKIVKALQGVDVITLRDDDSAEDLKDLGVSGDMRVTADPVFAITEYETVNTQYLLKNRGISEADKYVCVSLRKWKNAPEGIEEHFAKMCDYISSEYGYKIVFLPMQYPYDAGIIRSVKAKMKETSYFIDSRLGIGEMLGIIKNSELIIGVRLHILIYASTVAVPGIGIVYDPKVSSFQRYIHQPYFIEPRGLAAGDYKSVIDECIKNKVSIVANLEETAAVMRKKAEETADIAAKLINK